MLPIIYCRQNLQQTQKTEEERISHVLNLSKINRNRSIIKGISTVNLPVNIIVIKVTTNNRKWITLSLSIKCLFALLYFPSLICKQQREHSAYFISGTIGGTAVIGRDTPGRGWVRGASAR